LSPLEKNQKKKSKSKIEKKSEKKKNPKKKEKKNSSFKGGVRNVSMQTPDEVAEENLISYLPLIRPDPLN
jgi:hypothetical protein